MSLISIISSCIPFARKPYKLTCEDPTGLVFTVFLKAISEREVQKISHKRGLKVRNLEPLGRFDNTKKIIKGDFSALTKVKTRDVVSFYKQMAAMYKNNVNMTEALQICADSAESKVFKRIILEIRSDMERGLDFASCMSKHPKVFSRVACTAIKSADTGGFLEKALYSQAENAELSDEINRKLNGAMIYPAIVSILCLFAVFFFAYEILPNFIPLFEAGGVELPGPTKVMVGLSDLVNEKPWLIPIVLFIPIWIFIKKIEIFGSAFFQAMFLRLPLTKRIMIALYMGRFMRMIAQLTEANIPFNVQAIMLKESSNVPVYKEMWGKVQRYLNRGVAFNEALRNCGNVLPAFVVGNLRAGEKAGQIEEIANFVADYYESEVKEKLKNINALLEPILIVMLGCVIGFLLLAMFLPIFDLSQAI